LKESMEVKDERKGDDERGHAAGADGASGDEASPEAQSAGENFCPTCGGTGRHKGRECSDCRGTGRIVEAVGGG
jgi:DnaJ-class molecular chaperone